MPIDNARLPAMRSAAQLLHRPAGIRHPADIAREIGGAQAQEPVAGRLAFRARSRSLSAADVDRARTEERSLVRTWVMRRTMHLLAADDVAWMVPLFEPGIAALSHRRLADLGMSASAVVKGQKLIRRALRRDGPMTRDELAQRLRAIGIELNVQTRTHMFCLAVVEGGACQGPDRDGRTCLVAADEWLGPRPPHDREAALRELGRRYLRAFGPATETDFAGWAGLPLRDVRFSLDAIGGELREVQLGGKTAWELRRRARRAKGRVVRLLPGWDTYLMGYRARDFIAAGADWKRVMPGGGILRPAVVVDGVAVGVWSVKRSAKRIAVSVQAFPGCEIAPIERQLEEEVADIGRFESREAVLR